MADLCLCEYTDHGHCGPLTPSGDVDNDVTLERYASIAVAQAAAGAHVVLAVTSPACSFVLGTSTRQPNSGLVSNQESACWAATPSPTTATAGP